MGMQSDLSNSHPCRSVPRRSRQTSRGSAPTARPKWKSIAAKSVVRDVASIL